MMRRWRHKTRAMIAAQRFCLAVVVIAGGNWLLNVFHYHWLVRYRNVQIGTWLGCIEVQWFRATRFPPAKSRAFLGAGGVTGPNGLATVLGHIRWLPQYQEWDAFGIPMPPGPSDYSILLLPMWSVCICSGIPYILLAANARRRRLARLCDACDYSLVGLKPGADGFTICSECGHPAPQASNSSCR